MGRKQRKQSSRSSGSWLADGKCDNTVSPYCCHICGHGNGSAFQLVFEAHLVPGPVWLSVQDGAQASEAGVGPHLYPVHCRLSWLRRGRLDWTDVVRGFIRPLLSEVSQVREAQLLRLQWTEMTKGYDCLMLDDYSESQAEGLKIYRITPWFTYDHLIIIQSVLSLIKTV